MEGYISFPNNLPFRYFEELVCERRVPIKRMGVLVYRWEKPEHAANEMHDAFIYAAAAGIKHGVNHFSDEHWARLRAELEAPASTQPRTGRVGVERSIASKLAH